MKKKERVIIVVGVMCMIMTVLLGLTYAYWTVSKVQSGVNTIDSDCLHIEFTEANDIELLNTIPILDKEGLELEPYTFTIQNTCDTFANYQINLETFDVGIGQTRMHDDYIKANLQKGKGKKFSDILKTDYEVTPTITGATNAYKLATGTLKNGNVHTYNLRVWMDEHVTMDDIDSMNSFFNGKISVTLTAAIDPFSESGTLKKAPSSSPYTEFWAYKDNIVEVEFQNKMEPIVDTIESWDVSATKDGSVMAYMINNGTDTEPEYKVFIQGNNGIKANPNSSSLFSYFKKIKEIKGLEYLDTSNVTNMSNMFYNCSKLEELDVSNFDTSKVTEMRSMFAYNPKLAVLNINGFDTSNVTNMASMFNQYYGSELTELDVSHFDTSNVTDMSSMFYNCSKLEELDVSNFDTSNVTDMSSMFYWCFKLEELDVSHFDTSNVTNMQSMFGSCSKLEELDVSHFDISNITNLSEVFSGCSSLKSIDVSNFNTSNVTNMSKMFNNCSSLTKIDISNFDTSNVTDMSSMFCYCNKLKTLDLTSFDTSNVTTMDTIFMNCTSLSELNISSFNTSKVVNMSSMFRNCESLNELHVNNFDTSKVVNMSHMFDGCKNISELDISNFDTSNVTTMSAMFKDIGNKELDIINIIIGDNFDTSKVTNMSMMFFNDRVYIEKQKIVFDLLKLNFISVTNIDNMFMCNTNISGTINFNGINVSYNNLFNYSAMSPGAEIIVNYTSQNESLVDSMIATKSGGSNIVKGIQLPDYTISLDSSYSGLVNLSSTTGYISKNITLTPTQSNKAITSFKVNGTLVNGDSFTMPNANVTITDVNIVDAYTIESEHNPYANNINNEVYYENTFDNATSITVRLTYQTESTWYDWVYLYTSPTTIYQNNKYGGSTLKTETITYDGDYIKLTFKTNGSGNNYYGFKAVIIPNYD